MGDALLGRIASDGYAVVRSVVDRESLATWSAMVNDLMQRAHDSDESLRPNIVYEHEIITRQPHRSELEPESVGKALYLVDDLLATDPLWWILFETPGYRDVVADLVGHEPLFASSQCIIKEAYVGSRVAWHRDYPNSASDYSPTPGIRVLLSLDHMTSENGATMIIPESHHSDHPSWGLSPSEAATEFASSLVTIECKPGDVLAIHPSVIHGGGTNRSAGHRRIISVHWLPADTKAVDRANFTGFGRTLETRQILRARRARW
jgi:ectoine hydroxylase-related dioxygenase (phytanoyl-CoA dioxygenase family)